MQEATSKKGQPSKLAFFFDSSGGSLSERQKDGDYPLLLYYYDKQDISFEDIEIKNWNAFNYEEKVYSLDHLSEFEHVFVQAAEGDKPEKLYKFVIEFGLHCFTKGPNKKKNESLKDYDEELYYSDSRETRIFCFNRHTLSFRLPDIAISVIDRQCYHTGKGNFFLIEFVGEDGKKEEYEVYFNVARSGKGLLRLFIESAFIRDDEHDGSQPKKKKINFFVIAHKIQTKQEIKAP